MSSTSIRLHFSGDEYFQRALEAIEDAQEEVFLESYIYDLDAVGLRFLTALERAQKRGVKVKLLVDGIGSFNWLRAIETHCQRSALPLRVYHPLPIMPLRLSWRNLRRWLLLFRRINQRNHRKVILIDRRKAFLGSLNISQVHTVEFMGEKAWRDTGVEIEFAPDDPDANVLREAFRSTWNKSQSLRVRAYPLRFLRRLKRLKIPRSRFRLNSRAWWRFILLRDLLVRMNTAQKRILITNAYFLPRRAILTALRRAARRGVYVGLVLPQKTDVWLVREAARSLYYRLMKDGVHIFEYRPSILHAKTLIIDDWATVGSHNMNHRSLMHDLEVETVLEDPRLLEQLISRWDQDVRESKAIGWDEVGHFSRPRRWIMRMIYWFRYWL
jgi:cardiolipin synthase